MYFPQSIVTNDGVSFSGAVSQGKLINSFDSLEQKSVPIASIIQIMKFVSQKMHHNDKDKILADSLAWITEYQEEMNPKQIKEFYCNWEVAFRTIKQKQKIISIKHFSNIMKRAGKLLTLST